MPLVHNQEIYLEALKWLVSPGVGQKKAGRTETLAHAFIRTALDHPNKRVTYWDHVPRPYATKMMQDRIARLLKEEYKITAGEIRFYTVTREIVFVPYKTSSVTEEAQTAPNELDRPTS